MNPIRNNKNHNEMNKYYESPQGLQSNHTEISSISNGMKEKVIEFVSVQLGYGQKKVLEALSLDICAGDFWGIVGPNGSGKTTLLSAIMGLIKPQAGWIIREEGLRFGYCRQRQSLDTLFPFTVQEMVMMTRTKVIGPLKRPRRQDKEKVLEALRATGILPLAAERFYNLSGGQKQRTLIARALALEPNFLILDEPTADLDIKVEKEVLELIKTLHLKQGLTIALVTHELNNVINYAQKFIFLNPALSSSNGALCFRKGGVNKRVSPKILARDELSEKLLAEIFRTPIKIREIDGKVMIV